MGPSYGWVVVDHHSSITGTSCSRPTSHAGADDGMKFRDAIKLLEGDGWCLERTAGSHMQFRHPQKPGTVTVPGGGKLGSEVPLGTLNSLLKQAGLK